MTKGQAARALADLIGGLNDGDEKLQRLFTEANLKWIDFTGSSSERLFQAICRGKSDQLRIIVEGAANDRTIYREELTRLLSQFLSMPGTVWDERVSAEFIPACPYPGMKPFRDSQGFYGREELSAEIRSRVDESRLILLMGASGSGKSSVVEAGVFPGWKKKYGLDTTFAIRLGEDPFKAVYDAVVHALDETKAKPFRDPSRDVFSRLTKFLIDEGINHPLLFVDHFEKVSAGESEIAKKWRTDFAASLVDFANQNFGGARLILGIREDFLGSLSQFSELCRFTHYKPVIMRPMDADSLRLVVCRPAADHGVTIDDDIVQDIVTKAATRPGMLPLMQDILRQLWFDQAKTDLGVTRAIRRDQYFALGGVLGSLKKRLDALCVKKGEESLRRIFLRTVQVAADPNTPTISRHGNRDKLKESDRGILDDLVRERVLVAFKQDQGQNQSAYGLPHEAVIQEWDKLRNWIKESREALTVLARLDVDVSERERKRKEHPEQADQIDDELLWRGSWLNKLSKINDVTFEDFGSLAEMKEFREASIKLDSRKLQREIQRVRKDRMRAWIFASVTSVLGVIIVFFLMRSQAELAESNRRLDLVKLPEAQHAIEKNNLELAEDLLDDVKETNRCIAWRQLKQSLDGSIFTLYGHASSVTSVAISADGQRIVTGSSDGTVRVWDARTGQPFPEFPELIGHTNSVSSIAISADGELIVTGSRDKTARVWDARTGQTLLKLVNHVGAVWSVAISADGRRIVTGSDDHTAMVWDARTGQKLLELRGHKHDVTSVAISADGQRIVTGSNDGTVRVWIARTGQSLMELLGHESSVTSVAYSADGERIVTGSYDKTAKVWDARTGQSLLELKGHVAPVWSVVISADGQRIVTGSNDGTVRVWSARTGQSLMELLGHESSVTSVAYSADGERIVTGSYDKTAKVWNARTGQSFLELNGHAHSVLSVAISVDGQRIVTGSFDKTARVWNARTGQSIKELVGHESSVTSVAYSADGERIVTGSDDGTARVWDARTGQSLMELKGHAAAVSSVVISADGQRIVTGSNDKTARVWDAWTGQSLFELKGHVHSVRSVAISVDGQRIVTGSFDKTARVWDARTGQSLLELKGHSDAVSSVVVSANGQRIVTGSDDKTARVWDARTGQSLLELKGHIKPIWDVAISVDCQRIVTGSSDCSARVWDVRTGQSLLELKGHSHTVSSVAISEDGQQFVTGSTDGIARVWDVRNGQSLLELKGHTGSVFCVAVSADGQQIITGSKDKTARVWDARTGQSILELKGHASAVQRVAISADGKRIVTSSYDPTARVWDSKSGQSLVELKGHTDFISSVAISANGQRIVTGSDDQTARVWDARTGHSLLVLKLYSAPIYRVGISADGERIVTGLLDGTTTVWNAHTGEVLVDEPVPDIQPAVCHSPDKKWGAHIRFRKVVLHRWEVSSQEQEIRRWLTCPRPALHKTLSELLRDNAESLRNLNNLPAAASADFAAQVHLALEQEAWGQELLDAGVGEAAEPYFTKARELWPKPVPVEIVPQTKPE